MCQSCDQSSGVGQATTSQIIMYILRLCKGHTTAEAVAGGLVVAAAPEDFHWDTMFSLHTRSLLVCIYISRYISRYIAVIKYILSNYSPDTA